MMVPMTSRIVLVASLLLALLSAPLKADALSLDEIYAKLGVSPSDAMAEDLENIYKKYTKSKPNKALAIAFTSESHSIGYSYKAPSELGASQLAMSECEKFRTSNNFGGVCELLLLGDELVLPGAVIKRKVVEDTPAMAWRVKGDSGDHYLIGTVHVLKTSLLPLPAVFDQVFGQAVRVAFEINPILQSDPNRVQDLQALMLVDPKEQKSQYDKETRKLLKGFAKRNGIPESAAYTVAPVMNALQVSQLKMAALGYSFNTGVEMHYAREASKAGKVVVELEGPTDALAPLVNLPMETQLLMLRQSILQLDQIPGHLETLISSWLTGDAEKLYSESFGNIALSPELKDVAIEMLDKRNEKWMNHIEEMLAGSKSTVIMVGAAHFGGENGLLALLKQRGLNPVQLSWGGEDIQQSLSVGE